MCLRQVIDLEAITSSSLWEFQAWQWNLKWKYRLFSQIGKFKSRSFKRTPPFLSPREKRAKWISIRKKTIWKESSFPHLIRERETKGMDLWVIPSSKYIKDKITQVKEKRDLQLFQDLISSHHCFHHLIKKISNGVSLS